MIPHRGIEKPKRLAGMIPLLLQLDPFLNPEYPQPVGEA